MIYSLLIQHNPKWLNQPLNIQFTPGGHKFALSCQHKSKVPGRLKIPSVFHHRLFHIRRSVSSYSTPRRLEGGGGVCLASIQICLKTGSGWHRREVRIPRMWLIQPFLRRQSAMSAYRAQINSDQHVHSKCHLVTGFWQITPRVVLCNASKLLCWFSVGSFSLFKWGVGGWCSTEMMGRWVLICSNNPRSPFFFFSSCRDLVQELYCSSAEDFPRVDWMEEERRGEGCWILPPLAWGCLPLLVASRTHQGSIPSLCCKDPFEASQLRGNTHEVTRLQMHFLHSQACLIC